MAAGGTFFQLRRILVEGLLPRVAMVESAVPLGDRILEMVCSFAVVKRPLRVNQMRRTVGQCAGMRAFGHFAGHSLCRWNGCQGAI